MKKCPFIFSGTQVKAKGRGGISPHCTQQKATSIVSEQTVHGHVLESRKPVRQLNADIVLMASSTSGKQRCVLFSVSF